MGGIGRFGTVLGLVISMSFVEVEGGLGPPEFLLNGNKLRRTRTTRMGENSQDFEARMIDYMMNLRDRHNSDWLNFGLTEDVDAPNLGKITSIRYHRNLESAHNPSKWHLHGVLHFQFAPFPPDELLVASSLRLPLRNSTNFTFPVFVSVNGLDEVISGAVYIERDGQKGWLNVPFSPKALRMLLQDRRLLKLRVNLPEVSKIDETLDPHILTFHRSSRSPQLRRSRRGILEKEIRSERGRMSQKMQSQRSAPNHRKRRRERRKARRNSQSLRQRILQFRMNNRYIASACQRRQLIVDFDELGWSRWVLAPTKYDAGYCSGYCPFPLSVHFNTTNHAIILQLMHKLSPNPAQVPEPCCVPLTYKPQSMLFSDEGTIVLQVYEDMVVESCGCR